MRTLPFTISFGCVLLFVGCDQSPQITPEQIQQLSSRLTTVESNNVVLSNRVNSAEIEQLISHANYVSLSNDLAAVQSARQWDNFIANQYKAASLDTEGHTYSRVDTGLGMLFVKTESVEPYLDGFKVKLRVGNPSSVIYSDFKLVAHWGRSFTNGNDDFTAWTAAQKSRTNEVTSQLLSAAWNPVELILTPASPAELRQATVSIELNSVSLRTPAWPDSQ